MKFVVNICFVIDVYNIEFNNLLVKFILSWMVLLKLSSSFII